MLSRNLRTSSVGYQNVDTALNHAESVLNTVEKEKEEDKIDFEETQAVSNLWAAIALLDPANNKTDAKIVQKITNV